MTMTSRHAFFTKTMGDLYLKQGYVHEAEAVFKGLLEQNPERPDCVQALARCQAAIAEKQKAGKDLAGLLACWVGLIREEAGLT